MNCEKCDIEAKVIDIGSASGRATYRCPKCGVTWREKAHEKNPAAVALGSLGGKARAEAMTPEERSAQAAVAGAARWAPEGMRGMLRGKIFSNR